MADLHYIYDDNTSNPPPYAPIQAPSYEKKKIRNVRERLNELKLITKKYEIAGGAVKKLRQLESFDIVIIADDSSSMLRHVQINDADDAFSIQRTRWDELRERVIRIVEIASCLTPNGVDIFFLNRNPIYNVTNSMDIEKSFTDPPDGYTPLSQCYRKVLFEKASNEKKVLIVIATDGEPNKMVSVNKKQMLVQDLDGFTSLLRTRNGNSSSRFPTTIMACTDSRDEIGWLRNLDDTLPNVDTVGDYKDERSLVIKCQGKKFPFFIG